eukprot:GHRR01030228.1.p1 GENE.GHRR01030228.1~~GHRR01030228.1.p1  ORF type:complete len:293 (+),score=69.23 GHRR01030228.1:224-1102(+)
MKSPVAYTVQDVKQLQAEELSLVRQKLQALPAGLNSLTTLLSIDASDNPINQFSSDQLPAGLQELALTGCQLTTVPKCMTSLTRLERLHLSANKISNATAVFRCPHLVHAGLSYNHISSLEVRLGALITRGNKSLTGNASSPTVSATSSAGGQSGRNEPASSLAGKKASSQSNCNCPVRSLADKQAHDQPGSGSKAADTGPSVSRSGTSLRGIPAAISSSLLMSLDLAHNDITDLPAVLKELKLLSSLKSLSLQGNPISLSPQYRQAVLQELPGLVFLDGQVRTCNSVMKAC